ncbi:MAG: hypothetical protein ABFR53_11295 [Actinomycetota bacterium]
MERPGVVTFIGVLILIKSGISLVTAGALFLAVGGEQAASAGTSDTSLVTAGILELLGALLLYIVAWYLLKGREGARLFVAVVIGLHLAATVWVMLDHGTGGYEFTGLISAAFSLFILWSLYGNERSDEYFKAPVAS